MIGAKNSHGKRLVLCGEKAALQDFRKEIFVANSHSVPNESSHAELMADECNSDSCAFGHSRNHKPQQTHLTAVHAVVFDFHQCVNRSIPQIIRLLCVSRHLSELQKSSSHSRRNRCRRVKFCPRATETQQGML